MPRTLRGRAQLHIALLAVFLLAAGLAEGLMTDSRAYLVTGYCLCGIGAFAALLLVLDLLAPGPCQYERGGPCTCPGSRDRRWWHG